MPSSAFSRSLAAATLVLGAATASCAAAQPPTHQQQQQQQHAPKPARQKPAPPAAAASARSSAAAGSPQPTMPAKAARTPSVQEACGGKGYLAREWCETRACFQAEHQYDEICRQRRSSTPGNSQP